MENIISPKRRYFDGSQVSEFLNNHPLQNSPVNDFVDQVGVVYFFTMKYDESFMLGNNVATWVNNKKAPATTNEFHPMKCDKHTRTRSLCNSLLAHYLNKSEEEELQKHNAPFDKFLTGSPVLKIRQLVGGECFHSVEFSAKLHPFLHPDS